MRATWLTDPHLNFIKPPRMMQLCDEIRAQKPDVLFVTGDTGEAENVFQLLEWLRVSLRVPLYYVLGNHDFYGADIETVREVARERAVVGEWARWLPAIDPIQLTDHVVLVGVDGWGDAGCGDPEGSNVKLNDWKYIQDLYSVYHLGSTIRLETLRVLGRQEAETLRNALAKVGPCKKLVVLTHVPPFPEACVYAGKISDQNWLPWFTCVEVGKVLADWAAAHPSIEMLVLCGHTHGIGTYQHMPNLEVRTGGWPKGVKDYGNPIVQDTFEL